ncbi:hypothetical protein L3Y34_006651 [Caenorhabditis briggsae]|uniref:Guanylate cyclase domain-containing protein n=1 Tax=Caenorhabditis briggsae TaxID=6238 RepID=A0AAE8ZUU1_CAEBR|nr:hypothetical protein L3Y34_006651 [Caenorhabditis briggsae]
MIVMMTGTKTVLLTVAVFLAPGQIHISQEANEMLMRLGGFTTEPRGEVIVKGKGVMNTYWLKEMTESADPRNMEKKD